MCGAEELHVVIQRKHGGADVLLARAHAARQVEQREEHADDLVLAACDPNHVACLHRVGREHECDDEHVVVLRVDEERMLQEVGAIGNVGEGSGFWKIPRPDAPAARCVDDVLVRDVRGLHHTHRLGYKVEGDRVRLLLLVRVDGSLLVLERVRALAEKEKGRLHVLGAEDLLDELHLLVRRVEALVQLQALSEDGFNPRRDRGGAREPPHVRQDVGLRERQHVVRDGDHLLHGRMVAAVAHEKLREAVGDCHLDVVLSVVIFLEVGFQRRWQRVLGKAARQRVRQVLAEGAEGVLAMGAHRFRHRFRKLQTRQYGAFG